ncbi:hypothetical protein BOTBODRAFT_53435 [Botryobasidium botryosum FD-172 SS1]|uniref:Peptidase A1 domain-containing protein n=1 Tax=Botryobasidium botryosum (strain FD-172 SS1) TaxID=930990 RepID=A0A067MRL9_BOTB1|nr:hypothetical protein BOTBODRAFT_53435 [Botryobasidium botryosum FD-172 SS1]
MRPSIVAFPLVAAALARAALHAPITRYHKRDASAAYPFHRTIAASSASTTSVGFLNVVNSQNILYVADITIGNTDISVLLDTGSADLWIYANDLPGIFANAQNYTDVPVNITYGTGSASGFVSVIDVEFADIPVHNQALLTALKTYQQDDLFQIGAYGILGFGADSLSHIYVAMQKKYKDNRGQSLLSNIFSANASEPNHIAFFLDRIGDLDNSGVGTFSIGAFNPKYSAVQNQPELPVFNINAPGGARWSTLIDAVELSGKNVTLAKSTVSGVPSGKALATLDTGSAAMYLSRDIAETWLRSISGAIYVSTEDAWLVDCNAELQAAIWFKGFRYPIHPLDFTQIYVQPLLSLPNATYCQILVLPLESGFDGTLDYLLGDVFLRNVYSVFDFGDTDPQTGKQGDPYMKLLSITDEAAAIADFRTSRSAALATLLPLGDLAAVAAADKKANPSGASLAATDGGNESSNIGDSVNKLVAWAPAVLGLLGFNALALLALVLIGVILMRKGNRDTSAGAPRYQPVHLPPRKEEHAPYEEPLYEEHRYHDA